MNIGSINGKANTAQIDNNSREAYENIKENPKNDLAKVTDTASLSSLLPRLQNLLAAIEHPDDNVFEGIRQNITSLQDAFVDSLYSAVNSGGIDCTQKITLRLDENNCLSVIGEHPDREALENILRERSELSEAFKEISTQSELLKDVSNIGKIIGSQSGLASYQNALNRQVQASYQISLKGDMSHFYFTKA